MVSATAKARGKRLGQLRLAAGLTITDVSKRLECKWHTVSRYESGEIEPSGERLVALAELYGSTPAFILSGGTSEPDAAPSATRRAVEDFLASPLAKDVTPNQAEALRHINLNAVSPTIHTIYDIWRTTPWDIVEAQMVDGKMPSARGAKIPGRKGGNKPSR